MSINLMKSRVVSLLFIVLFITAPPIQAQHAYRQLREFGFVAEAAFQPLTAVAEGSGGWLYGVSYGGNGAVIYRVKKDGSGFSVSFDFGGTNGFPSSGPLIVGSDAGLYGTCILPDTSGALYKIQPDGGGFTLHPLLMGAQSISGVIEGQDGKLYGTTFGGGAHGAGTLFAVNKNGTGFTVLHHFAGDDGLQPTGEPLEGSNGQLYLVTRHGGSGNAGTVSRINKNGSAFLVIHHFPGAGTNDGRMPNGRLTEGAGGYLYGSTDAGGIGGEEEFFNGFGVVFRISNDGDIYSVLRRFEGSFNDGQAPRNVFVGSDGRLFGTSRNAGYARNVDGLFRMETTGNSFGLMYSWVTADNQTIQLNALIESADGNFYGTSAGGGASNFGQAFKVLPNGTQYQNLHDFSSVGGDGNIPWALLRDSDGALYGSTLAGGANDTGTIYKLEPDGSYRILHEFTPQSGWPLALIAGSDGFLYGSSYFSKDIFRLAKDGTSYTVLTNLLKAPSGPMIEGSDFLLYGVTETTVFRLNPDGTSFEEVHSFTNVSNDPAAPLGVVEASDGKLYGTSIRGGATGQGMVFKLNKDGSQYQALYSFVAPVGTLVWPNLLREASDGFLYGTTYRGGGDSEGTIFRISKSGNYEFVNAFASGRGNPVGQLAEGPEGWLYGVTQESGDFGGGHLFRFRLGATSTVYILHHFGRGDLGRDPGTGVALDPAGAIYGTTQYGGFGEGFGTVFRVDVMPIMSIARAGGAVEISWPQNGDAYNLWLSENPGSPWTTIWSSVTNAGERVIATVPTTNAHRFFQLVRPPLPPVVGR